MPDTDTDPRPPAINYILSFLLVGLAWGLTTPFIRRAARAHKPDPAHAAILDRPAVQASWLRRTLYGAFFSVLDLLRNPRYAVPLVLNLTGSVWFFLLIGKAGMYHQYHYISPFSSTLCKHQDQKFYPSVWVLASIPSPAGLPCLRSLFPPTNPPIHTKTALPG
ncbi:hypothetical protein MKX08_010531 [Trichoderma sp. CBMAI-0020]|nr:hypothetical protein MKX08_010531 [Trichoderma sp. CBMAI-0020]